jgi:hypothetical protein
MMSAADVFEMVVAGQPRAITATFVNELPRSER